MKTEDFDKIFDDGEESIIPYLDMTSIRRPNQESVRIDFPTWMLESLDKESARLGVNRQALVKFWIADRLATT